jgi:hypothetical protein
MPLHFLVSIVKTLFKNYKKAQVSLTGDCVDLEKEKEK